MKTSKTLTIEMDDQEVKVLSIIASMAKAIANEAIRSQQFPEVLTRHGVDFGDFKKCAEIVTFCESLEI